MTPDVTSLLPLLPEMPRLAATDALAGAPASALAPGGGAAAPDFAGLLEALAAPPPAPAPASPVAVGLAPLPLGTAPAPAPALEAGDTPPPVQPPLIAAPRAETPPATALAAWPTGKNLPEPGALLPLALPLAAPAEADPSTPPPVERPFAAPEPLPGLVMVLRSAVPDEPSADALPAPLPDTDAAERPVPPIHARVRSLDPAAPVLAAPVESAPAPGDEAALLAEPVPAADLTLMQAVAPDPGIAPQPIAPVLTFVPVLTDDAVAAPLAPAASAARAAAPTAGPVAAAPIAAALPVPPAARPAPAASSLAAPSSAPTAAAPSPMQAGTPAAPTVSLATDAGTETAEAAPAPAPTPALPAETASASTFSTRASPDAGNAAPAPAATLPSNPAPALPQTAAILPTERPADPRAVAANPPAPQLESTIAQVGDIREALRAARPAMTLQHAEFGAVSIRLEPAAPDQWRAVLASRDPGFVPAIQAALDARAIAAAGDTSTNFAGQHGAHQNGTADHRYGASPNGGQGSPQPYLGQSGSRDGEAAPDHRRPSTAAALAARADGEVEDPAAASSASGGLFA